MVFAGTTSGFGAKASRMADFAEDTAPPDGVELDEESGAEAWSVDF
jgi:hypothetical protein